MRGREVVRYFNPDKYIEKKRETFFLCEQPLQTLNITCEKRTKCWLDLSKKEFFHATHFFSPFFLESAGLV